MSGLAVCSQLRRLPRRALTPLMFQVAIFMLRLSYPAAGRGLISAWRAFDLAASTMVAPSARHHFHCSSDGLGKVRRPSILLGQTLRGAAAGDGGRGMAVSNGEIERVALRRVWPAVLSVCALLALLPLVVALDLRDSPNSSPVDRRAT